MTISLVDMDRAQEVATADWTVLAEPQVESVCRAVARSVSRDYGLTLEYEDAVQETTIIVAERASYARQLVAEGGAGLLHRWLSQRLRDRWLTEAKHRSGHVSYEAALNATEGSGR
ncbi:hypothetical protein ACH427_21365 [Streptomyces sp. NPDC020379]|uniref:hypothetical protein n=1 Tax=Streptomyces sp. NPDC020379 TaxID=3365071 RepID=UPI003795E616